MKKILLFALFAITTISYAQVTIGSDIVPLDGALLDLKEQKPDANNVTATKGLLLPRVKLTNLKSLVDIGITSGTTDAQTGMVVYNVSSDDACTQLNDGVYYWMGTEWIKINGVATKTLDKTSLSGLDQPNSYLFQKEGVFNIPLDKVQKIWDGTSFNNAGTPLLTPKTLDINNLDTEITWTDNANLFCGNNEIVKGTNFSDSYIKGMIKKGQKGNAIISVYQNNGGKEILWSWHIWVVDDVKEVTYNGKKWLSLNMGALSAAEGDTQSKGFLYQWGRKDPMVSPTSLNKIAQVNTDATNLANTITNPISFITVATSDLTYDWYSKTANKWSNRWGDATIKSPTDPCPEGWKVPAGTYDDNEWSNSISLTSATNGMKEASLGYLPFTGTITSATGTFTNNNAAGYYWTSFDNLGFPRLLYFTATSTKPIVQSYSSEAFAVRCVSQ